MEIVWSRGTGKWYKRQLNKRRRKQIKLLCKGHNPHERGLATWESKVNWKGS